MTQPPSIQSYREIVIELEQTKDAFNKLETNFQHNLKVIEELESMLQENQIVRTKQQSAIESYQLREEQLLTQIQELRFNVQQYKLKIEQITQQLHNKIISEHQQLESVIETMNQKMRNQLKRERTTLKKQQNQHKTQILKYQQTIKFYTMQNSKLLETINSLKNDNHNLSEQYTEICKQKQNVYNKLSLHEKQIDNIRNANLQWESILKDKIKDANKEKNRVEEEFNQCKVAYKFKIKAVKEECSRKIEEIVQQKQNMLKSLVQDTKQIKLRYDTVCSQKQSLKTQTTTLQKQNSKYTAKLKQYQQKIYKLKDFQQDIKIKQQEIKYLQNQVSTLKSQNTEIKEQYQHMNNKREEAEKSVERLKTAMMGTQKMCSQLVNKNKKLEREVKQMVTEKNKVNKEEQVISNNYVYDKIDEKDQADYSKYFSEDMGPIDDNFLMGSSIPRSPKMKQNPSTTGPNHQLMKKIGELQVQIDQYKTLIKSMSDDIQKTSTTYTNQLSLKDQQIKLSKQQVNFLREKINEKQHQILNLSHYKADLQVNKASLQAKNKEINQKTNKISEQNLIISCLQGQIAQIKEKMINLEEIKNIVELEKNALEENNQELRSQLHIFKNRVKIYDDDQECQSEEEDDGFQEISYDQNMNQLYQAPRNQKTVIKERKQFNRSKKRLSKQRRESRSHSGNNKMRRKSPQAQRVQGKTSTKLRDLVMMKKQLQMKGQKAPIQVREQVSHKSIQKMGTKSQKDVYQALKKTKKEREQQKQSKKAINFGYLADQIQKNE